MARSDNVAVTLIKLLIKLYKPIEIVLVFFCFFFSFSFSEYEKRTQGFLAELITRMVLFLLLN